MFQRRRMLNVILMLFEYMERSERIIYYMLQRNESSSEDAIFKGENHFALNYSIGFSLIMKSLYIA